MRFPHKVGTKFIILRFRAESNIMSCQDYNNNKYAPSKYIVRLRVSTGLTITQSANILFNTLCTTTSCHPRPLKFEFSLFVSVGF